MSRLLGRQAGRIGGTLFSFLYVAVRALLGAFVRSRRGLDVKDIELIVLRHELDILRRQVERPRLGLWTGPCLRRLRVTCRELEAGIAAEEAYILTRDGAIFFGPNEDD